MHENLKIKKPYLYFTLVYLVLEFLLFALFFFFFVLFAKLAAYLTRALYIYRDISFPNEIMTHINNMVDPDKNIITTHLSYYIGFIVITFILNFLSGFIAFNLIYKRNFGQLNFSLLISKQQKFIIFWEWLYKTFLLLLPFMIIFDYLTAYLKNGYSSTFFNIILICLNIYINVFMLQMILKKYQNNSVAQTNSN